MKESLSLLTASDLYAISQRTQNKGDDKCHWCGSKCSKLWPHGGQHWMMFKKDILRPKCPANHFMCFGCWLWRRQSITVFFLAGYKHYKDRQSPENLSWWIAEDESLVVRKEDKEKLKQLLLKPPKRFCLSLLETPKIKNLLHLSVVNDNPAVQADTILNFTVDNTPLTYTVYELQQTLKYGPEGKQPGARFLYTYFGSPTPQPPEPEKQNKIGRPKEPEDARVLKKFVTTSGGQ